MAKEKRLETCENGHRFYKSTDCPSCPECEKINRPESGFLAMLSSPARNALLHEGIDTVQKLGIYTEKEILALHGIGKASLPVFRKVLSEAGLEFKKP